jgi:hypothetical protein
MSPLLDQMKSYVAYTSVGASTVRGMRSPGLVRRARVALSEVDLSRYAKVKQDKFQNLLDEDTSMVLARTRLPKKDWGVGRKVLNIFLRGALYNVYLREQFRLDRIETIMEIPLDSLTAKGIKRLSPPKSLPRWKGVRHLSPSASAEFQARAIELANSTFGTNRVHLDIYFYTRLDGN